MNLSSFQLKGFLVIFPAYMLIMILIGIWSSKREKFGGTDYIIANRGLSLPLLLGTSLATMIGTGSSMGAVGKGYVGGFLGALVGIGGFLGLYCLTRLFAENRKYQFITMTEEIAYYYENNKVVRILASVLLYLASIGWLGAHILGGSYYLSLVTGWDLTFARVMTALGFGIYVIIGGYLAVVWTDMIQVIIVFLGFILVTVLGLKAAGGFEGIKNAVPAENLSFLGIAKVGLFPALSILFAQLAGVLGVPSYRQRIYSADSVETAKKSYLITSFLYLAFTILPVTLGLSAYALNPHLEKSNFAFPFMITHVLPGLGGVFVLIAGLSATMSSGDSDAMTGVSILTRDIWTIVTGKPPAGKKLLLISRWSVVFTILAAFSISVISDDIIGYITNMVSMFMSGLAVCTVLGKLWKRATWQGAIAALAGGSLTTLLVISSPLNTKLGGAIIPALLVAFLAEVIVSLLSPAPRKERETTLEELRQERRTMEQV